MTTRSRTPFFVAGLVAALTLGLGLGAAAFAVLDDSTTTIVRQVTVEGSEPVAAGGISTEKIYDSASKAVVEIAARGGSGFGGSQNTAQGSGFVVDEKGHIVTNQHVVAGASSISVSFWNGAELNAEVVGTDPSTDLAVLRVAASRALLEPLLFADSSTVEVGDPVLAFGSPFGLEGTVTSGIVSALHREMTAPNTYLITDTIQTDAAINHGNSGGPLLDGRGRVIGVNAQIESESGGSDGVGFAIPSNTVKSIVTQILEDGAVQHAYLGVAVTEPTGNTAGAQLAEVRSGGPAAGTGLQVGDLITAIDGRPVASAAALQAEIDAHRPGDRVIVDYLRNGAQRSVTVTLGTRPS